MALNGHKILGVVENELLLIMKQATLFILVKVDKLQRLNLNQSYSFKFQSIPTMDKASSIVSEDMNGKLYFALRKKGIGKNIRKLGYFGKTKKIL